MLLLLLFEWQIIIDQMNELITRLNELGQQLPMPNPNLTRPREMGIVFAKRNTTPPWIRDTLIGNNNYRDIAIEFLQTSYQLKLLREQETMVG